MLRLVFVSSALTAALAWGACSSDGGGSGGADIPLAEVTYNPGHDQGPMGGGGGVPGPEPDSGPDVPVPEPDLPTPEPDAPTPQPDVPTPEPDVPPTMESTPLTIRSWRPFVVVDAPNAAPPVAPIDFYIDTGSPVTVLDTDHFPGGPGKSDTDLTLFDAVFNHDVVRYNLGGSPPQGATLTVGGIIGSDFLKGHELVIDYAGAQGWLDPSGTPPVAVVGGGATIDFQLKGGGTFNIPEAGSKSVGATRVLVEATVEGVPVTALVDTGAAYSIVDPDLISDLGGKGRPVLSGVRINQSGGNVDATLTRVETLKVGGATVEGAVVAQIGDNVLGNTSAEVGQEVRLFVGGTFLRHFLLTLDYTTDKISLRPYADMGHIDPDEWLGPGLRFQDGPGGDLVVYDVFGGSAAEAAGVQEGWRLAEIEGKSVAGYSPEAFAVYLSSFDEGTVLDFGFRIEGSIQVVSIDIEDQLPAWP